MSRENQEDQSILVKTSLKVFLTRVEVGIGEPLYITSCTTEITTTQSQAITAKYSQKYMYNCNVNWPRWLLHSLTSSLKIPLTTSQTRSFKWMPAMSCVRIFNTQQNTHLDYLCVRSTKIWRYIKSSEEIQCPIYRRMNGTITSSLIWHVARWQGWGASTCECTAWLAKSAPDISSSATADSSCFSRDLLL